MSDEHKTNISTNPTERPLTEREIITKIHEYNEQLLNGNNQNNDTDIIEFRLGIYLAPLFGTNQNLFVNKIKNLKKFFNFPKVRIHDEYTIKPYEYEILYNGEILEKSSITDDIPVDVLLEELLDVLSKQIRQVHLRLSTGGNEKLITMINEANEVYQKISTIKETDKQIKQILTGFVTFWSPLSFNPNILIFGINPSKWEVILPPKETQTNNYFYADIKKCLADKNINRVDLLDNAVITNRYFFGTEKADHLKSFFEIANKYFPEKDYYLQNKQEEWIRTIITELKPKLMIAAGKILLDRFDNLFPDSTEILEQGKYTKVLKINNIVLIIYKRNHNNIANKKEFVRFLDKYTQGG